MKESSLAKNDLIAPGPSRNCPKAWYTSVHQGKSSSNDMVHNYYLEKAKKSAHFRKTRCEWKTSMIDPARLPTRHPLANGCNQNLELGKHQ
ncbi:hypothetical protein Tco_0601217 [Tanacetum coccineum]